MEIIRRDELQELLDVVRMKPYGKILITGAAGSGKTFVKYNWKDIRGTRKKNLV